MSSSSRKNRSTRSQDVTTDKDASSSQAKEIEVGQTEVRSIVHQELSVARSDFFSGPLPHPGHLREYEKILPGSADRVIKMAEEQAQHRRQLETLISASNTKLEGRGQIFGFVIAMTALIGGGYIMASGQSVGGAAVAISAVAGLSGLFFWKSRERKRELNQQLGAAGVTGPAPPDPPQNLEQ